jgi:hypothetical protein
MPQYKHKYFVISLAILSIFLGIVFFVGDVWAQGPNLGLGYVENTGLEAPAEPDVRVLIANIVRYVLTFVGLIAVIFIIYAGFLWMTSNGDPAKVDRARKTLLNAASGLIVVILSFALVTFFINLWSDFTSSTYGNGKSKPGRVYNGIGAIGNCSIETVFPEPGQTDVARNTALIATFREPVDPDTICQAIVDDGICDNEPIIADRFRLFEKGMGDSCEYDSDTDTWINCDISNITEVLVSSTDNKTFFFLPVSYLGSESANVWHTAYLSNEILLLEDSRPVFDTCAKDYYNWSFEVSNRVDLEPPIVKEGGIFPPADNLQDISTPVSSVQAEGLIAVSATKNPAALIDASATNPVAQGTSPEATLSNLNIRHSQTGTLLIAAENEGDSVAVRNQDTNALLGAYYLSGNSVEIEGLFNLEFASYPDEGDAWIVTVAAYSSADTLRVGSITYNFVDAVDDDHEILAGTDFAANQANIIDAINNGPHPDVEALADAAGVRIRARRAGVSGNSILLAENSEALNIDQVMSGGLNASVSLTTQDLSDKPRNAVIQINFNEAVNPLTLSGEAQDLQDYIRVVCVSGNCSGDGIFSCVGGNCVEGQFAVSNQYRTVEFISNNECGVNSCGEPVYCLPESSNLRIEIIAAQLEECVNCAAKNPYTDCQADANGDSHCYNAANSTFHPLSSLSLMNGVMDMAMNSLDGNRSEDAEGPMAFFDQNSPSENGDNFEWSFWISSEFDISSPQINLPATKGEILTAGDTDGTIPANSDTKVSLTDPLIINFNKLMMSSTLTTGSKTVRGVLGETKHRLINLKNFNSYPTGYWVASENQHIGIEDNEPEWTRVELRHTEFGNSMTYRAQVGSGVKDIYQNCYMPSAGPACWNADADNPTCCSGALNEESDCD